MLRLMLNQHSRLHIPRESWFIIDLMNELPSTDRLDRDHVRQVWNIIRLHRRWKDWEISDDELHVALTRLYSPTLREVVDQVFQLSCAKAGKARWGDKTPEYVREIPRLQRLFPAGRFIHLIRDARDVCISLRKTGWRGHVLRDVADYWADYVGRGIADGRRLIPERYMELSYEALVRDARRELDKVCEFLGVAYEPEMMDFHRNAKRHIAPWEAAHHGKLERPARTSDAARWRRELSKLEVLIIESRAGHTMQKAGQERTFDGVARLAPILFSGADRIATWSLPVRRKLGLHFPWFSKRF